MALKTQRRPHRAGSSRPSRGMAEVQSKVFISCRAAGARRSAGRCSRWDEMNGRLRCKRRHCNAPPVPAQPPAPPLALQLQPLRQRRDVQAQRVSAEQLARQSSHLGLKAQLARRELAQQPPARQRAGLPRCRPWETSEPEAGRAPATGCQEQSPERHHRSLAASLRPRRHSTTHAI